MMNLKVEAVEAGAPVEGAFDLQSSKEKGPSGRGGKKILIGIRVLMDRS